MRPHWTTIVVMVGALLGLSLAAVSTYDFAEHLDRQVHSIHCSFIPGMGADATGTTGCHTTMMSPYSSVMRTAFWGGIPISLPAMSVFGFILFFAVALLLARRQEDRRATGFLLLATALPFVASILMAVLSFVKLGTACKVCVGIYVASAIVFIGAFALWRRAVDTWKSAPPATASRAVPADATVPDDRYGAGRTAPREGPLPGASTDVSPAILAFAFALGVVFVVLPVIAYAASVPDYSSVIGSCGRLEHAEDPSGVMVPLGPQGGGVASIEVLDPLCPACRAFEMRLDASGMDEEISRKAVLFPLDNTCNWMVNDAIHPGACTMAEAMLCAGPRADAVLEWAFEEQADIRDAASRDPRAAERLVRQKFPNLSRCIGSPAVRAKLNRSLRWVVNNRLPVLTPQMYVNGAKLCDEDTDLGMDYALSRLLAREGGR